MTSEKSQNLKMKHHNLWMTLFVFILCPILFLYGNCSQVQLTANMNQKSEVNATLSIETIANGVQVHTFPEDSVFTFSGFNQWGTNKLSLCGLPSNKCNTTSGIVWPGSNFILDSEIQKLNSGAALRGNIIGANVINSKFNTMQFELHSGNYFSQNTNAHIAVGPISLLPYEINGQSYNDYPPLSSLNGLSIPYGLGNIIMLGNVPCKNGIEASDQRPGQTAGFREDVDSIMNGVGIEHLLAPFPVNGETHITNKTWCALRTGEAPTPIFADDSTYRIRIAVKQDRCTPSREELCRWVGYTIEKKNSDDTFTLVQSGGGSGLFPDQSAIENSSGWNTLKPEDRSAFYIAHVFSRNVENESQNWMFTIKELSFTSDNNPPSWWDNSRN